MNKIGSIVCAAVCAASLTFVGCDKVPSPETMSNLAGHVGIATAIAVNEFADLTPEVRNATVEVMNEVRAVIPETNQTFEAAWTPIAEAHIAKLVADGKLDEKLAPIVLIVAKAVFKGIDFAFAKYPKAYEVKEVVVAGVNGFFGGFLTWFKPANSLSVANSMKADYDKDAYDHIKGFLSAQQK